MLDCKMIAKPSVTVAPTKRYNAYCNYFVIQRQGPFTVHLWMTADSPRRLWEAIKSGRISDPWQYL